MEVESMAGSMVTTFDNPYNPFTQFKEWFIFDNSKGYNTCGKLARIMGNVSESDDELYDSIVEQSIDDLIASDPLNIYRKVSESDYKKNDESIRELKKSIEDREKREENLS